MWLQTIGRLVLVSCAIAFFAFGVYWFYFNGCETKDCRLAKNFISSALWVFDLPAGKTEPTTPRVEDLPTYQDLCFGPSPQEFSQYVGWALLEKIYDHCKQPYFEEWLGNYIKRQMANKPAKSPDCASKRALATKGPFERADFLFNRDGEKFCQWASNAIKSEGQWLGRFFPQYPSGKYED